MRLRILPSAILITALSLGAAVQTGCSRTSANVAGNAGSETPKADEAKVAAVKPAAPVVHAAPPAEPAGYEFAEPVRIKAGEEFVQVESPGYACPTMADVDGDGKEDLVVGQFSSGHMQFCKNVAAEDATPKFAAAEWIMTGDERAVVPGVW